MNATASKIVLQDIKVFAVDTHTEHEFTKTKADQGEPMTAKTISLLVTPRQAEILHAATEMSGSIRLVLRNPEDDTHFTSEGATIADIFGPDERSDRTAEDGDKDKGSGDDLTQWLNGAKNNQQQPVTPPPPVPNLPLPAGPRGKMIVMYGSELMQVDFPADGGPPVNPFKNNNNSFTPSFGPSSQLTGGAGPAGGDPNGNPGAADGGQDNDNNGNGGSAPGASEDKSGEFIEDKNQG